MNLILLEIK